MSTLDSGSPKIASGLSQPSSPGSSLPNHMPHKPMGIQISAGTINMPATPPPKKVLAPHRASAPAIMAPMLCEAFHQPIKRPRYLRGVHRFMVELQQGPPGACAKPFRLHSSTMIPIGWFTLSSTPPTSTLTTPALTSRNPRMRLVFRPSHRKPRISPPKP